MQLFWVLLGSVAALASILLLARVRLELEGSARGEPDGSWAAAWGVALGPLALTGVAARGVPLRLELHVFGRRRDLSRWGGVAKRRASAPLDVPAEGSNARRRWLGEPLEVARFVLEERRRMAIESLRVELGFDFRDIALTGKIVGALYALSSVLPSSVEVVQTPRWDGAERWYASARGRIGVWPGLVLVEVLCYILRRTARRPPAALRAVSGAA